MSFVTNLLSLSAASVATIPSHDRGIELVVKVEDHLREIELLSYQRAKTKTLIVPITFSDELESFILYFGNHSLRPGKPSNYFRIDQSQAYEFYFSSVKREQIIDPRPALNKDRIAGEGAIWIYGRRYSIVCGYNMPNQTKLKFVNGSYADSPTENLVCYSNVFLPTSENIDKKTRTKVSYFFDENGISDIVIQSNDPSIIADAEKAKKK